MNHRSTIVPSATLALLLVSGAVAAQDPVEMIPESPCIWTLDACNTVTFEFVRTNTDEARGISVTFALSPELELCDPDPFVSIQQGDWLSSFGSTFQIVDNLDGSYTVDQAILGLPCGEGAGGTLFTVDVQAAGADGTGTMTITDVRVRDCVNVPLPGEPGAPLTLTIDTAGPVAIADLSATQLLTGNDADGTTKITLDFTAPGDADVIEVWRAGFGDYPEYDDGTGVEPATPAVYPPPAPWTQTGVTASGQTDEVLDRDYYYFVAFTKDVCGNVSAVSNKTGGTLNYHLGDVTDGFTPGQGDNMVDIADITLLGDNYGKVLVFGDPVNYLDVGPTSTNFVDGLPLTDDLVEFEDLILFAINAFQVSAQGGPVLFDEPAGTPHVTMRGEPTDGGLVLHLELAGNPGSVKGLHVVLDPGGLELVQVERGALLDDQAYPVFFAHLAQAGAIVVDAAILGDASTIHGQGTLATIQLRGDPRAVDGPRVELVDLRDLRNRPFGATTAVEGSVGQGVGRSARFELLGATPNPFNPSTVIRFRSPERSVVTLTIYDVAGRLLDTLVDGPLEAGEHAFTWNGRDAEGRELGSGVYFYDITAGAARVVEKLVLVR